MVVLTNCSFEKSTLVLLLSIWVWMILFFSENHRPFGIWALWGSHLLYHNFVLICENTSEKCPVTLDRINLELKMFLIGDHESWEEMAWIWLNKISLEIIDILWEIDNVFLVFSLFTWLINVLQEIHNSWNTFIQRFLKKIKARTFVFSNKFSESSSLRSVMESNMSFYWIAKNLLKPYEMQWVYWAWRTKSDFIKITSIREKNTTSISFLHILLRFRSKNLICTR